MFTDMVARSEPFLDFARKLKRPLRVATMCRFDNFHISMMVD